MSKKKKKSNVERRFVNFGDAEIRLKKEDGKPTKIVGYFAKFNKTSHNLGGFVETIEPGFFRKALENSDVLDLFNHNDDYVLGRQSSKTLKVFEDKIGLRYECIAPETQFIKDLVLAPIGRGDIKGNSFGFRTASNGDRWEETEDGKTIRYLLKDGCKELIDGSQVTRPAYPDTDVALRSMSQWQDDDDGEDNDGNRQSVDYGNSNSNLDLADLTNKLGQATDENRSKFIGQINKMLKTFETNASSNTATSGDDDNTDNDADENKDLASIKTRQRQRKLKLRERNY